MRAAAGSASVTADRPMLKPAWRLRCRECTALLVVAVVGLAGCGGRSRTPSTASRAATTAPATASESPAAAVQQQFVAVIKQTQPQVVQIQSDSGLGSGVIFDAKGNIVTNAHVVSGASQLAVTLADGRRFDARLVGAYVPDDLAVVDIGDRPPDHPRPLRRLVEAGRRRVRACRREPSGPSKRRHRRDRQRSRPQRQRRPRRRAPRRDSDQRADQPRQQRRRAGQPPWTGGRDPHPGGRQPPDRKRRRRNRLRDPQQHRHRRRRPDHPLRPGRELTQSGHRRQHRQQQQPAWRSHRCRSTGRPGEQRRNRRRRSHREDRR